MTDEFRESFGRLNKEGLILKIPCDKEGLDKLLNRMRKEHPDMFEENGELKMEYRI